MIFQTRLLLKGEKWVIYYFCSLLRGLMSVHEKSSGLKAKKNTSRSSILLMRCIFRCSHARRGGQKIKTNSCCIQGAAVNRESHQGTCSALKWKSSAASWTDTWADPCRCLTATALTVPKSERLAGDLPTVLVSAASFQDKCGRRFRVVLISYLFKLEEK